MFAWGGAVGPEGRQRRGGVGGRALSRTVSAASSSWLLSYSAPGIEAVEDAQGVVQVTMHAHLGLHEVQRWCWGGTCSTVPSKDWQLSCRTIGSKCSHRISFRSTEPSGYER